MARDEYVNKVTIKEASLWKDKRPLLVKLDMEITERCNNNCIHCCINRPANDEDARRKELSSGELREIMTEAASLGCMRVRFTGGEPLLRDDFEELYVFARKSGLKVLLFTNATLITRQLADLFARIPPLERIEISLYGMRRESYEGVSRTPGSYEAAWRGVRLLSQKRVPFVVKSALLPPNSGELEEFEAWASTVPWMDRNPPYSMFFDLRSRWDSEKKNREIRALRPSPQEGLMVLTRRPEEYTKEMREFCSKFMHPPGDRLFSCGAGVGGACVDAYGNMQPCLILRHPDTVYDLNSGSLRDALEEYFPGLRETKATDPDYLDRCARCFLKGLCEQCPGKSWGEHATLDTPVQYCCDIAHEKARYLRLLDEGEKGWEIADWRERIRRFTDQGQPCRIEA